MINFRSEFRMNPSTFSALRVDTAPFCGASRTVRFQGETPRKKTTLSDEDRAARKALDANAPDIRKALPMIFKLWSPLPANGAGTVKYGHITKFLDALKKTKWYEASPELQQMMADMIASPNKLHQSNELHQKEKRYLDELTDIRQLLESDKNTAIYEAMLKNMPMGPFRDSVIEALVKRNVRAGLDALPTVENPAMRASLSVMVQNLEDFNALREQTGVEAILDAAAKARPEEGNVLSWSGLKEISDFPFYYPLVSEGEVMPNDLRNLQTTHDRAGENPLASELPNLPAPIAPFLKLGLEPYLNCGFSLLDIPPVLGLLSHLGQDQGTLISEVIPAYKRFVEFSLQRADKFVKAGDPIPSPDKIRAMLQKDGIKILKTIILVGDAPLKNALDMKRLPNLLNRADVLLRALPEMAPSVSKLGRMFVDPYDCLKLLDFIVCLEGQHAARPEMADCIEKMIQSGQPDMNALGKVFLKKILADEVLKEVEITDEQVNKWNLQYLSTLAAAIKNMRATDRAELLDVCKAALEGRYPEYLHDPDTALGKSNLATRAAFENAFSTQGVRLNYQQWLNYKGQIEFERPSNGPERQALNEELNKVLAETFIKNSKTQQHIHAYLESKDLAFQEGRLVHLKGKEIGLREYVAVLDMGYKLNEVDHEYRERVATASRIYGRFRVLPPSPQRLKIELWDREPGHDLFLGNYTGACIALDNSGSGKYAVDANQNTFIQVAYVKNPETNKVVGKAAFYMAKDLKTGNPIMVLNTYEGRGDDNEGSYEYCPTIRRELVNFARDYSRAVVGWAVPLYTGSSLNPICTDGLPNVQVNLSVVGSAYNDRFYLDSVPHSFGPVSSDHNDADLLLLDLGEARPPSGLIPVEAVQNRAPGVIAPSISTGQNKTQFQPLRLEQTSPHRIESTRRRTRLPV